MDNSTLQTDSCGSLQYGFNQFKTSNLALECAAEKYTNRCDGMWITSYS